MSGVSSFWSRPSPETVFTREAQKGAEKDRYKFNDPSIYKGDSRQAAEGLETNVLGNGRKVMATRTAMRPRSQQVMYMVA